jgi:hypothetical protein
MAQPIDDHEELPRTPSNRLLQAVADGDFIVATNADTMQSPLELGQTPRVSLLVTDSIIASGRSNDGSVGASVPRGRASIEQLVAWGNHWSDKFEGNVEFPNYMVDTEGVQAVEPGYITYSRPSASNTTASDTWEAKRLEIHKLWIEDDLPLPMVITIMAEGGFNATSVTPLLRFLSAIH